jgi:hypothetical protein
MIALPLKTLKHSLKDKIIAIKKFSKKDTRLDELIKYKLLETVHGKCNNSYFFQIVLFPKPKNIRSNCIFVFERI